MKSIRSAVVTLCLISLATQGFGFSTNNTNTSRSFDKQVALVDGPVTVTVNFANLESNDLRGFYHTEHVPQHLSVITESVKIDGNTISNYIFEFSDVGDVYTDTVAYHWVLETPTAFNENNPIIAGSNVEIVYSVSSSQSGAFHFDEFNWVGYYPDAPEGTKEAFGHSEDGDKVKITFTHAPVALSDTASTNEDTPVVIEVLANDSAPDPGDTLTVQSVTDPAKGAAVINGDGTVTYTPSSNLNGVDTFNYTVQDSNGVPSNEATVTVTVNAVNDAPSFTKGLNQTVLEDAGAQTEVGWATGISAGPADEVGQSLTFNVTGNTNPGLFSGGPSIAANGTLTYTPAANANGSADITIELQDNGGTANGGSDTSPSQTFTINVTGVNDAPAFTKGSNQTVLEDAGAQTEVGWATGISAGPADEVGQSLTFNVTGNTNPGLFPGGPSIAANGTLTYTPAANANGSADITIELQDNGGTANGGSDTSPSQTFTINVTGVNDAPVAFDDSKTTQENTPLVFPASDLTVNDEDVENDPLTVTGVGNAQNGTVSLSGSDIIFTPAVDFYGGASFEYTVSDNNGGTDTATVSVIVNPMPVSRLDIDLKIKELKELKESGASEDEINQLIDEIKHMIGKYMEFGGESQ